MKMSVKKNNKSFKFKLVKPQYLIGIDEVGRGPIAGPVAVGAFCISIKDLPKIRKIFRGVKESKQLSEKQREEWFKIIQQTVRINLAKFEVSFQSEKIIDTKGLSYAIKTALEASLKSASLSISWSNTAQDKFRQNKVKARQIKHNQVKVYEVEYSNIRVLLDGGLKAPAEFTNQKTIIKGDEKELVIALASICAKVLRDREMNVLARKYPQYGFEKHKGYGTRGHYEAIGKYGVISIHRKSFLKNF